MKKLILSVAVLLSALTMSAQNVTNTSNSNELLRFGFKAGINYSNIYSEEGNDFVADGKVGFAGGAFVSIPLGPIVGIQPEIMYSQKGYQATGSGLFDYEYTRTLNYLDLPLLLQIKPTSSISLLAGPQFSYLLSTKTEFNDSSFANEEEINDENYKKGIIGLVVGADFNVSNFIISARGGFDMSKTDTEGETSDLNYKNQVLQLTVGYIF